jgi:membrane-associated protease RseP (regulator of RpoE activity)
MNPFENDVPPGDEHRAYGARPRWQRSLVILAGPLSHFVVGGLILGVVLAVWGRPTGPWRIDAVPRQIDQGAAVASPAFEAGLRSGDVILSIAGVPTSDRGDIERVITSNIGSPVDVVVDRNGQQMTVALVPVRDVVDGETRGRLGVVITAIGTQDVPVPLALVQGFGDAASFSP